MPAWFAEERVCLFSGEHTIYLPRTKRTLCPQVQPFQGAWLKLSI